MKYRVYTASNQLGIDFDANNIRVDFNGTLLLTKGAETVAAFAAGNWTEAREVQELT